MSLSLPTNVVRTDDGRIIGTIVQVWTEEQGYVGSFYQPRVRVPRGACVDFGINGRHLTDKVGAKA